MDWQQLSTVNSELQPKPVTIASAATIAPSTFLTTISGTVSITTITPPIAGAHMLALRFTNAYATALNTGGNVSAAITSVANRPILVFYDPITSLYYPMTVA